jgi:hypothetical protein
MISKGTRFTNIAAKLLTRLLAALRGSLRFINCPGRHALTGIEDNHALTFHRDQWVGLVSLRRPNRNWEGSGQAAEDDVSVA